MDTMRFLILLSTVVVVVVVVVELSSSATAFTIASDPHPTLRNCWSSSHHHHLPDAAFFAHRYRPCDNQHKAVVRSAKAKAKNGDDFINDFCQGTNAFWKNLVIQPVRDYVQMQPAGTASRDALSKLIAPPEVPGIPRPVWLTILGSVPTALGWYGYYKFSVEEELFQYELQNENGGRVTGCGGYGTLLPFVYGVIVGFPLKLLHLPGGEFILEAAALWILLGQVNLYRRVNELCVEETRKSAAVLGVGANGEPPLYTWWALLPPPLDVVVGLRQVHFLSEYWRIQRNEPYDKDVIAEELFPFISAPSFTLRTFFRTPSMWFWLTKDWKDFDFPLLQEDQ
jgi:hypothetical protein